MSKYDSATPFIASYMIFRNDEGQVAFLLRSNTPWKNGFYTLPSGKVEPGEFYTACAVRESKEEVGVDVQPKDLVMRLLMHRHEVDSSWVDAYIEVTKWKGDLRNAEPDKHGELVWFSLHALPDNIVPGVRVALKEIAKGNFYSEYKRDEP